MAIISELLIVIVAVSCGALALNLPQYIVPCKKSDPNLQQCAIESAKKTYPHLLKGHNKYKIQKLDPVTISLIEVDAGPSLKLSFNNFICNGLPTLSFKSVKFDLEKKHYQMNVLVDYLNFVGDYDMKGRILVLPIQGNGDANITFVGGDYKYSFDWDLETRDGKEYIKIKNPVLDFELKRAYFHFENLFNGDKRLGDEMNRFLNENWADVMKDIGKGIGHTIEVIVSSVYNGIFNAVPYDDIFID